MIHMETVRLDRISGTRSPPSRTSISAATLIWMANEQEHKFAKGIFIALGHGLTL